MVIVSDITFYLMLTIICIAIPMAVKGWWDWWKAKSEHEFDIKIWKNKLKTAHQHDVAGAVILEMVGGEQKFKEDIARISGLEPEKIDTFYDGCLKIARRLKKQYPKWDRDEEEKECFERDLHLEIERLKKFFGIDIGIYKNSAGAISDMATHFEGLVYNREALKQKFSPAFTLADLHRKMQPQLETEIRR